MLNYYECLLKKHVKLKNSKLLELIFVIDCARADLRFLKPLCTVSATLPYMNSYCCPKRTFLPPNHHQKHSTHHPRPSSPLNLRNQKEKLNLSFQPPIAPQTQLNTSSPSSPTVRRRAPPPQPNPDQFFLPLTTPPILQTKIPQIHPKSPHPTSQPPKKPTSTSLPPSNPPG